MRKALVPMLASLALCGAAVVALVATNARAQTSPRKPVMVALVAPGTMLAQNTLAGPARDDMRTMPGAAEMAVRLKQMCEDHYAREVGRMAYLEARLNLTQPEQPLFARWKSVKVDIAKRRSAECSQQLGGHGRDLNRKFSNPVERMTGEQDMLKRRLADLDAERPVLAALYGALTPQQREALSPRGPQMAGGVMDPGMMRGGPMEMGDPPLPPPQ
ncbi:MAG: Spy/CpxP family protein refolding chaperone [Rhizomicrobium sp.]